MEILKSIKDIAPTTALLTSASLDLKEQDREETESDNDQTETA